MWMSWPFRREVGPQDEVKELTAQFYVTLRSYAARLDTEAESRAPKSFAELGVLLSADRAPTWSDAYHIEQLLVDLFSESTLEVELQSRLLEAASSLRRELSALYTKQAATLTAPLHRRALLARLMNDLQWKCAVNEVKRTYAKGITRDTGMVFMGAILAFGVAFVLRQLFGWPDHYLLVVAGLAGGWGAAFSMLATLRSCLDAAELNDLKRMRSRWIIWSRPLIGAGAACILYFFLVSGLLSGSMFPHLGVEASPLAEANRTALSSPANGSDTPIRDLALLVVWCFIAGFSEQLVPTLVAKTESRLSGQWLGPVRFEPGNGDGSEESDPAKAGGDSIDKNQTTAPAPTRWPTATGSPKPATS